MTSTCTGRVSKHLIARLANLERELSGNSATNINIADNTTTTITLVHTASTNAITVQYAST